MEPRDVSIPDFGAITDEILKKREEIKIPEIIVKKAGESLSLLGVALTKADFADEPELRKFLFAEQKFLDDLCAANNDIIISRYVDIVKSEKGKFWGLGNDENFIVRLESIRGVKQQVVIWIEGIMTDNKLRLEICYTLMGLEDVYQSRDTKPGVLKDDTKTNNPDATRSREPQSQQ